MDSLDPIREWTNVKDVAPLKEFVYMFLVILRKWMDKKMVCKL